VKNGSAKNWLWKTDKFQQGIQYAAWYTSEFISTHIKLYAEVTERGRYEISRSPAITRGSAKADDAAVWPPDAERQSAGGRKACRGPGGPAGGVRELRRAAGGADGPHQPDELRNPDGGGDPDGAPGPAGLPENAGEDLPWLPHGGQQPDTEGDAHGDQGFQHRAGTGVSEEGGRALPPASRDGQRHPGGQLDHGAVIGPAGSGGGANVNLSGG